ncbi:hypothetical protein PFISCL1PPCAC_21251, partial [Pristionchus fissidentatus]
NNSTLDSLLQADWRGAALGAIEGIEEGAVDESMLIQMASRARGIFEQRELQYRETPEYKKIEGLRAEIEKIGETNEKLLKETKKLEECEASAAKTMAEKQKEKIELDNGLDVKKLFFKRRAEVRNALDCCMTKHTQLKTIWSTLASEIAESKGLIGAHSMVAHLSSAFEKSLPDNVLQALLQLQPLHEEKQRQSNEEAIHLAYF